MQKSVSLTLVILLSIGNTALAVPGIDVGTHTLTADAPDQTVEIFVTGADPVQGLNFRVLVADGFPDAPESSVDGPNITAIDIVGAGTIFGPNNSGQSNVVSFPQAWDQQTTTSAETVNADGLLARLTLDTTGFTIPGQSWALSLTGNSVGGLSFDTDFGVDTGGTPVIPTITNGTIQIEGVVAGPAIPDVSPNPAGLDNFHVGETAQQALTISNVADAGSESLNASFNGTTGDVSAANGSVSNLGPQASDNSSMTIDVDTNTAGAKSGTATVDFESVGSGPISPSEVVDVSASVYRLADPSSPTPDPIDFGVLHVGDAASQALSIANQATDDGFSESLNVSANSTGDAVASGAISQLAPGATDSSSISAGIDTTTPGFKSGTVALSLESDGEGSSGLGTTSIGTDSVTVQAQVNAFADPVLKKLDGDGSLTKTGSDEYTLNFGRMDVGSGDRSAELELMNDTVAPADDLSGDWTVTAVDFTTSGFDPFSGLAPGDTLDALMVGLSSDVEGNYSGMIQLNSNSEVGASFSQALDSLTLVLQGSVGPEPGPTVVPEPATLALLLLAAFGILPWLRLRRRIR